MGKRAGERADYGVDAPGAMRNLFLIGGTLLLLTLITPARLHIGNVVFLPHYAMTWTGGILLAEALLFLLYVKYGKFRHRDFMLELHAWRGDEEVLDVGCGRGLLLAGVAKRLEALGGSGQATGIDVWSNVDMGGNSEAATWKNLEIEGVRARCRVVGEPAQAMGFADASFDVVVSNLCLHNIYNAADRRLAVEQIARVLRPGGVALLSDYKKTGEYAEILRDGGLLTEFRRGSWVTTFPPLRVVIARKPASSGDPSSARIEEGKGELP